MTSILSGQSDKFGQNIRCDQGGNQSQRLLDGHVLGMSLRRKSLTSFYTPTPKYEIPQPLPEVKRCYNSSMFELPGVKHPARILNLGQKMRNTNSRADSSRHCNSQEQVEK